MILAEKIYVKQSINLLFTTMFVEQPSYTGSVNYDYPMVC